MKPRTPPRFALWLLKHWGSRYHSEALAGDLLEQYQEGRSRAWCWRQTITAILLARGRFIGALPWTALARVSSYLLAEAAAVLAIVVIVDHERRIQILPEPISPTLIGLFLSLIAVAGAGFLVSARSGGSMAGRAAAKALLLAFGVIALGVGTLTWALTAP